MDSSAVRFAMSERTRSFVDSYDLIIIGAGCAGLSLGSHLAELGPFFRGHLRVLIIEAAAGPAFNKTWGVWQPRDTEDIFPVSNRLTRWSFSAMGKQVVHRSEDWEYAIVEGCAFFSKALDNINTSGFIELRYDCEFHGIESSAGKINLSSSAGPLSCTYLIDTRPPDQATVDKSKFFQVFLGAELRLNEPRAGDSIGLMEGLLAKENGLHFDYILPLSSDRLLVESTVFAPAWMDPMDLQPNLDVSIRRHVDSDYATLVRTESGVIPMGLPTCGERTLDPRIIPAGVRGGALRASSGYAFSAIQKWAKRCAENLVKTGRPISGEGSSPILRWMDDVFLRVLARNPTVAPDYFMKLAGNLSADSFARFMASEPRPADLFRIIRSLPAGPFVSTLFSRRV